MRARNGVEAVNEAAFDMLKWTRESKARRETGPTVGRFEDSGGAGRV
jgi:hypothetical protein